MNRGKNRKDKGFLGRRLLLFGITLIVFSLAFFYLNVLVSPSYSDPLCTITPIYNESISNNQTNITVLQYNDSFSNNQINHETEEKNSILSRETVELVSAFLSFISAIVGLVSTCLGGFIVYLNYKERKEEIED